MALSAYVLLEMSFLLFSKIVLYTSMVIFLVPPVRQYGTRYFLFFLILGIIDPVSFLYRLIVIKTIPFGFYIFANFLLLISLLENTTIKKNRFLFIVTGLTLIGIIIFANFSNNQSLIILLAFQLLMLATILKRFIINYAFEKKINVFQLIIIFYFLTIITKFFNLLTGFADAIAFFIITSIAQIIFGLYFSIVRENKPEVIL
jgi:hypothetical protein